MADGWRITSEDWGTCGWKAENREWHWEKHEIDFPIVNHLNWNRIAKRLDSGHPDNPPRFQAVAELHDRSPPQVFVVVYQKFDGTLWVISVRYADEHEVGLLLG